MWLEIKKARNFNAVVWVLGEVNRYIADPSYLTYYKDEKVTGYNFTFSINKAYPGTSMLDLPMLENREPLQAFLTLSKLAEFCADLDSRFNCGIYYRWSFYGNSPFEATQHKDELL